MPAGESAAMGFGSVVLVVVLEVVVVPLAMPLRPLGRPCCVTIVMVCCFKTTCPIPLCVPFFVLPVLFASSVSVVVVEVRVSLLRVDDVREKK